MALIICENCGKKVSDTAKNCIHCGASLLTKEVLPQPPAVEEMVEQKEQASEKLDNFVKFKNLEKKQQEALLKEFWKEDLPARKYQKKKTILEFFQYGILLYLLIPNLVAIVFLFVFRFQPQSTDGLLLIYSLFAAMMILQPILLLIFGIIMKLTVDSKVKTLAYKKRFQIWAKETKQIVYKPTFENRVESQMFEQIDVKIHKL